MNTSKHYCPDCGDVTEHEESFDSNDSRTCLKCGLETSYKYESEDYRTGTETYGGWTVAQIRQAEDAGSAIPPSVWHPFENDTPDAHFTCKCGEVWAMPAAKLDLTKEHKCICGIHFTYQQASCQQEDKDR